MSGSNYGNGYYVATPTIESLPMRDRLASGCRVHLKLENTQPSSSFKLRGISHLMLHEHKRGATGFVASSGGNAGMAAAFVAQRLQLPLRVFVPSSIKPSTLQKLQKMGAEVEIVEGQWEPVDKKARESSLKDNRPYIHPFDHPILWEGHATMIEECYAQLEGTQPDLVIVAVGGGGLLMGVALGMEKVGWGSTPILAMETEGTASLNKSLQAGRLITLDGINSIASSLGATRVSKEVFELSQRKKIISRVVSDKQCVDAISKFLEDHLMLVEPACGAALSAVYSDIISELQRESHLPASLSSILVIVCGGRVVGPQQLCEWKKEFSIE